MPVTKGKVQQTRKAPNTPRAPPGSLRIILDQITAEGLRDVAAMLEQLPTRRRAPFRLHAIHVGGAPVPRPPSARWFPKLPAQDSEDRRPRETRAVQACADFLRALWRHIQSNIAVHTISVRKLCLPDHNWQSLGGALSGSGGVRTLHALVLSDCRLGDSTAAELLTTLGNCCFHLKRLDLCGCGLRSASAHALALLVAQRGQKRAREHLQASVSDWEASLRNFAGGHVSPHAYTLGAEEKGSLGQPIPTQIEMHLSRNAIGASDAPLLDLAEALRVDCWISVLDLSANRLSPASKQALREAVADRNLTFCARGGDQLRRDGDGVASSGVHGQKTASTQPAEHVLRLVLEPPSDAPDAHIQPPDASAPAVTQRWRGVTHHEVGAGQRGRSRGVRRRTPTAAAAERLIGLARAWRESGDADAREELVRDLTKLAGGPAAVLDALERALDAAASSYAKQFLHELPSARVVAVMDAVDERRRLHGA